MILKNKEHAVLKKKYGKCITKYYWIKNSNLRLHVCRTAGLTVAYNLFIATLISASYLSALSGIAK
jgi:hypothetical protein